MTKMQPRKLVFDFVCAKCAQKLEFDKVDGTNVYLLPCEKCAADGARALFAKAIDSARREPSK